MSIEENFSVSSKIFFVLSRGLSKFKVDLLKLLKTVPGEYFAKLSKKYPKMYCWDSNWYGDDITPELQVYYQCINDDGELDCESYDFIKIPSILLC